MARRFKLFLYVIFLFLSIQFLVFYEHSFAIHNGLGIESRHWTYVSNKTCLIQPLYSDYVSHKISSEELQIKTFTYNDWHSTEEIERGLSVEEHKQLMNLLQIIDQLFRANNITYMISSGTLLGSYRHHDVIPWDDDCDVIAPYKDKTKIFQLLNSTAKSHNTHFLYLKMKLYDRDYVKFYYSSSNRAGFYFWKWPFVDIFFYVENSTHIFDEHNKKNVVAKKFIFPLTLRPLGRLLLPAPRDPLNYLKSLNIQRIETICKAHPWNHKKEKMKKVVWPLRNCSELYHLFPFVIDRYCYKSHCEEELQINTIHMHTFLMRK